MGEPKAEDAALSSSTDSRKSDSDVDVGFQVFIEKEIVKCKRSGCNGDVIMRFEKGLCLKHYCEESEFDVEVLQDPLDNALSTLNISIRNDSLRTRVIEPAPVVPSEVERYARRSKSKQKSDASYEVMTTFDFACSTMVPARSTTSEKIGRSDMNYVVTCNDVEDVPLTLLIPSTYARMPYASTRLQFILPTMTDGMKPTSLDKEYFEFDKGFMNKWTIHVTGHLTPMTFHWVSFNNEEATITQRIPKRLSFSITSQRCTEAEFPQRANTIKEAHAREWYLHEHWVNQRKMARIAAKPQPAPTAPKSKPTSKRQSTNTSALASNRSTVMGMTKKLGSALLGAATFFTTQMPVVPYGAASAATYNYLSSTAWAPTSYIPMATYGGAAIGGAYAYYLQPEPANFRQVQANIMSSHVGVAAGAAIGLASGPASYYMNPSNWGEIAWQGGELAFNKTIEAGVPQDMSTLQSNPDPEYENTERLPPSKTVDMINDPDSTIAFLDAQRDVLEDPNASLTDVLVAKSHVNTMDNIEEVSAWTTTVMIATAMNPYVKFVTADQLRDTVLQLQFTERKLLMATEELQQKDQEVKQLEQTIYVMNSQLDQCINVGYDLELKLNEERNQLRAISNALGSCNVYNSTELSLASSVPSCPNLSDLKFSSKEERAETKRKVIHLERQVDQCHQLVSQFVDESQGARAFSGARGGAVSKDTPLMTRALVEFVTMLDSYKKMSAALYPPPSSTPMPSPSAEPSAVWGLTDMSKYEGDMDVTMNEGEYEYAAPTPIPDWLPSRSERPEADMSQLLNQYAVSLSDEKSISNAGRIVSKSAITLNRFLSLRSEQFVGHLMTDLGGMAAGREEYAILVDENHRTFVKTTAARVPTAFKHARVLDVQNLLTHMHGFMGDINNWKEIAAHVISAQIDISTDSLFSSGDLSNQVVNTKTMKINDEEPDYWVGEITPHKLVTRDQVRHMFRDSQGRRLAERVLGMLTPIVQMAYAAAKKGDDYDSTEVLVHLRTAYSSAPWWSNTMSMFTSWFKPSAYNMEAFLTRK